MYVQIRGLAGDIKNQELDSIGIVKALERRDIEKVSFNLDDSRLILRPDGTYQILGGFYNYPNLG